MAIDKITREGDTFVHTFEEETTDVEHDDPLTVVNEDGSIEVSVQHAPFFSQQMIGTSDTDFTAAVETDDDYQAVVTDEDNRG